MTVHIEYCEKWNYFPEFERVSNIIKNKYKHIIIEGNSFLPRTGSFEIKINNILKYSKFETNKFPTEEEILSWFNNK